MAELKRVNDNNFQQEVLQSNKLILVHFMATWSGPCKMLRKTLGSLSEEYAEKLYIYELDSDASPNTYSRYKIRVVPTTLLFKAGEVVDKIVGDVPPSQIEQTIKHHI